MRKITAFILVLLILWTILSGCAKKNYYNPDTNTKTTEDTAIQIKAITLEQTEMALNIGETALLNATVSPGNAKNLPIKWTSSDSNIISVNKQGVIFAKRQGKASIVVSDEAEKIKASCEITVNSIRKAVITDNVPAQSLGGQFYSINVDFENCTFPSMKIVADCGGGNIKTESETIKLGSKEGQYQLTGKAVISFGVSSYKDVSHLRILCFDNGELFDCKEYNVSLVKVEEVEQEQEESAATTKGN